MWNVFYFSFLTTIIENVGKFYFSYLVCKLSDIFSSETEAVFRNPAWVCYVLDRNLKNEIT